MINPLLVCPLLQNYPNVTLRSHMLVRQIFLITDLYEPMNGIRDRPTHTTYRPTNRQACHVFKYL